MLFTTPIQIVCYICKAMKLDTGCRPSPLYATLEKKHFAWSSNLTNLAIKKRFIYQWKNPISSINKL